MYIVLPAIIVNILAIIVLTIGLLYNFKEPKNKAIFGYWVVGSMILYILFLSIAFVFGVFVKHNLYSIILLLCVVSPFAIGKFVKYETLKKYTAAQIICFVVSLAVLLLKF
jgi:hypothetical protein